VAPLAARRGTWRYVTAVNGRSGSNGRKLATTTGNPNYRDYLDHNGDGAINGLDLAQYRTRFGSALP
jgi:hypothetical protein